MLEFLLTHPDLRMAGFATLVGGPAVLAVVFIVARFSSSAGGWKRLGYIAAGLAAGAGIWTTHFVAMITSQNGVPRGYGLLATFGAGLVLAAVFGAMGLDRARSKTAVRRLRAGRDAALEQARRAELAEDVARLGHWRLDLASNKITWSKQMYAIYGLDADAPLDLQALVAMGHPDDAEANAARMADQRQTGAAYSHYEIRIIDADGATRWLEGNSIGERDDDGSLIALVGTILEITAYRRLEEDLRAARAEAEAAAAVKGEFLANMSHELRTPLTSILGFADLLSEQTDLPDNARRYVDRMHGACRALLCTVNDILDFSKLEAGQVTFHPQPMSPVAVARSTLELFAPQAAAKDIRLTLAPGNERLGVLLDPDRIRQILLNLVSNAVKFTAQGEVTLSGSYDAAAGVLRYEVADAGPGVAADDIALLFQRFSQIDGGLSRAGGAGLGLAICKGLVEAMGGTIGVDSEVGVGSRFWFAVPAAMAPLPAAKASGSQPADVAGLRLLVVDDQAGNRELVRLFLEPLGVEVTEAANGAEAVGLAQAMPYDVILMDLRMPGLDGSGAAAAIRAGDGPNDATPILAYTAETENDPVLLASGFDGVVFKPVAASLLLAAVRRAVTFEAELLETAYAR